MGKQLRSKQKRKLRVNPGAIIMIAFTLYYIVTSFFSDTESVVIQTMYNIFIIAICIYFIQFLIKNKITKIFLTAFWIGQACLYLYNYFLYPNYNEWIDQFNSYELSVTIYVLSIIMGYLFIELSKEINKAPMIDE